MKKEPVTRVGDIITVKLLDRMVSRQTRTLSRMLQQSILTSGGKVRLLVDVETCLPARSPESLMENLQFIKIHSDYIDRVAIVGGRAWEKTGVALFGLFGGVRIEYFDRSEARTAIAWLMADGRPRKEAVKQLAGPTSLARKLRSWFGT